MGCLFIVTAPSGAGKTSLIQALLAEDTRLRLSVSCTTRAPRAGEVDGRDYHFLTVEEFQARRERGEFLEWAEVYGNLYGTLRAPVEAALASDGPDLIFDVDWQGARRLRERFPEAASVYILPPSPEALRARLRARATDAEEVILRRLAQLGEDVRHVHEFDYGIVNDLFDEALVKLRAIVRAERCRTRLLPTSLLERFYGPHYRG
ncbi:MAG: guanylate kinase [Casimicrobiaceae bacterium]|nr:guanylate kinase [Casimicrobiaceae bacterium]